MRCPRCKGYVRYEQEDGFRIKICFNCGWREPPQVLLPLVQGLPESALTPGRVGTLRRSCKYGPDCLSCRAKDCIG